MIDDNLDCVRGRLYRRSNSLVDGAQPSLQASSFIPRMPCISFRQSIRWLPDDASEPTITVVLTGSKTGCFIDIRFIKGTSQLDWAFAGYRSSSSSGLRVVCQARLDAACLSADSNSTKFVHWIDSGTLSPRDVDDRGTNTALPDGTTLEAGSMVNPLTGRLSPYEEIWKDKESDEGLFIRNTRMTKWQARVGAHQLALGRDDKGRFWAWQAEWDSGKVEWKLKYSTESADNFVRFLPGGSRIEGWLDGDRMEWNGDEWDVLEHSDTVPAERLKTA